LPEKEKAFARFRIICLQEDRSILQPDVRGQKPSLLTGMQLAHTGVFPRGG
jgi:hypothetical protein